PRLAVDAGDRRDSRRVRTAVVRHGVRRDLERRVGLGDGESQGGADVIVIGVAVGPGLAIAAGVGAGQARAVQLAVAGDAGDRDDLRVGAAVVHAAAVAADQNRSVRLVDGEVLAVGAAGVVGVADVV